MKNTLILVVGLLIFSTSLLGQNLKDLDYVSPLHEELAAIKKDGKWAFIDSKGEIIIDFRDDLVISSKCAMGCCSGEDKITYPLFKNGRSLIQTKKDGITHYGYIDKTGATVIEAKYINATHFTKDRAIVIEVNKTSLGRNDVLGKEVVKYTYNENVINTKGEITDYLRGPNHLLYSQEELKNPPPINSHFLNSNLIAVQTEKGTWEVRTANLK